MYVHIYKLPENFLKPSFTEMMSRYWTPWYFLETNSQFHS